MSSVFRIINNTNFNSESKQKQISNTFKDRINPFILPTQTINSNSKNNKNKSDKIIREIDKPNSNIKSKEQIDYIEMDIKQKEKVEKKVKKIYWEYGNSGLKIKDFDKKMSRNLSILEQIDKIFVEFNNLPANSLGLLFNSGEPIEYQLGNNKINVINLESVSRVNVTINENKISGVYQVLAVGFTEILNIKINENDLTKKKISSFDNFISRLDNIKSIYKIINILTLDNKFEIYENNSIDDFNLSNIVGNFFQISSEFKTNNQEKKLLKSNTNSAFYIKIYETSGMAFIIDSLNNLIYYIIESENLSDGSISIRYYLLNCNDKYKIKST